MVIIRSYKRSLKNLSMSGESLKDRLIQSGIISQEEADIREESIDKKESNRKYFNLRKRKKSFLQRFSVNRNDLPVLYSVWFYNNSSDDIDILCGLCGDELSYKIFMDIVIDGETFLSDKLLEKEFINFYINKSTHTLSYIMQYICIPEGVYVDYHIEKFSLDIKVCFNCLFYYLKNKFYPNFIKRQEYDHNSK